MTTPPPDIGTAPSLRTPAAPARSLRQRMSWLHGWAGLILGWLVFAIALSGTASVWKDEIGGWMRPEVAASADPAASVVAAVTYLRKAAPASPDWFLTAPGPRATATLALYQSSPPGAPPVWRTVALDPVTGRPDGIRDTLGGEFLYRLHFELQMPYPWGRLLASAAGMLLLVTLISGIITHKRIFADFFTVRPGKGKRSWLDLHNALGVFAMPFHLMIAATGVLTLVTLTLPWGLSARYGTDVVRAYAELTPGFLTRPALNRPAPSADLGAMLADARRRFGGGRIGMVGVAAPGDAAAVLRVTRNDADQIAYGAAVANYDMATGRLLAFHRETRPAKRTFDVFYGLHLGRFTPTFARWLYFMSGLALSATVATGLVLWTVSRPLAGFGNRLVARLTVGSVAGMPLAIAALFWANRLVPADLPGRAELEVRSFFVTLSAALVAGSVLRPRAGWRLLGLAVALAWLLLPLVSALTTDRGLARSVARGDWLFAGFDLTALALGGATLMAVLRYRPGRARRAGA